MKIIHIYRVIFLKLGVLQFLNVPKRYSKGMRGIQNILLVFLEVSHTNCLLDAF